MIAFVLVATALVIGALLFVLLPLLWRARKPAELTTDSANIKIYGDQLRELDDDLAAGTIDRERHAEAKAELERRLLEDTGEVATATAVPRAGKLTAGIAAVLIPLAVTGLYFVVGTPEGIGPQLAANSGQAHGITAEQVRQMVDKLAARLRDSPDDGPGWAMLARSHAVLGQFGESAAAYAQAVTRIPDDAQLLADYADVLAMTQGRRLMGEPEKLIERALRIDPNHPKALALAGTAAFGRKQYDLAVKHWTKLKELMPADSEMAESIRGGIAEAQALGGKGGAVQGSPGRKSTQQTAAAPGRIGGSLQIAAPLKARAAPGDTVFIFARAANGPAAPLAVLRKRVADLPLKFELNDSMAMAPGMNLSRFSNVVVGARISRSGKATPEPGDLEGLSGNVKVGATDVVVVIDSEVR